MANMGYCRFQNTANDLRDCVSALEEAGDFEELDLSDREASSAEWMLQLCQRYVDAYYDLKARADSFLEEGEVVED